MSHQPFANFEIVRLEAMIIGLEIDKEQLQRDIYHLKNRKTQIHNKKIELLQQKEQLIREISVLRETKSSLVNETKDLREEMLELKDTDGSNDDDTLCAVCYTRKRNYACIPCGHRALCNRCAETVSIDGRCPFCREELIGVFKIFSP